MKASLIRCQKKFIPPPKRFQKRAEKKGKKTKRSERGPKKSAQNSPATFQSTQNGANES